MRRTLVCLAGLLTVGIIAAWPRATDPATAPPGPPAPINPAPLTAAAPDPEVLLACAPGAAHPAPAAVNAVPELARPLDPTAAILLPRRDKPIESWRALNYFCRADFNRDDAVDDQDTRDFLDAWASREGPYAPFLDVNHDGWLNADDVDAFFDAYSANDCDPAAIAEYRLLIC